MQDASFHLAADDGAEDFRQGSAQSSAAPSADASAMTPWFPIKTKPVRKGVYMVSCRNAEQSGRWYSYWNGRSFGWYSWKPQCAFDDRKLDPGARPATKSWRGLTQARSASGSPARKATRPDGKGEQA